jgi:hypothetical protein
MNLKFQKAQFMKFLNQRKILFFKIIIRLNQQTKSTCKYRKIIRLKHQKSNFMKLKLKAKLL